MKKILIVTIALLVVVSFGATHAQAADYGTWLFIKGVIAMDNPDVHHGLTPGAVKTDIAAKGNTTPQTAKPKIARRDSDNGLFRDSLKKPDMPRPTSKLRFSRR